MFGEFDLVTTLLNMGVSLVLGYLIARFYMFKSDYNKQFVATIAMLPAIVSAVIFIVNGNLGTGVAVMGAFSLVRFRSIPGTAKEIAFIFFSMAVGLATGMGYLMYAGAFVLLVGTASILLFHSNFAEQSRVKKQLKVTIPENLDYTGLFDDLFSEYTESYELTKVKTTNLGSLFQISYEIVLSDEKKEKEFLDQIRCRNGNLDIICGRISTSGEL
jgi:hypothetical protein